MTDTNELLQLALMIARQAGDLLVDRPASWDLTVKSTAIDIATQYVKERQAFGQHISQFQNTRFVLAQAKIDEQATAAFYNQNVELYMQGKLDVETAAALKSFSTDMQMKVADNLLQLFGGYGYMSEYPISRFFVDARIQRIYGGTNEIMKEIVARSLLGR